jgi:hypothetical protein
VYSWGGSEFVEMVITVYRDTNLFCNDGLVASFKAFEALSLLRKCTIIICY